MIPLIKIGYIDVQFDSIATVQLTHSRNSLEQLRTVISLSRLASERRTAQMCAS